MAATTSGAPGKRRVIGLGEVLWDLLPAGKQLGGAPCNFAYHARALGADSWVISRVGADLLGQEILRRLGEFGFSTALVAVDPRVPTGTVSIDVSADGQPRFTIHQDVAWDYLEATDAAYDLMSRSDAVCFGSLCQRSAGARAAIRSLVSAMPETALKVFDINLRQTFFSPEVIQASLQLANVLKINDQELPVLAEMFKLSGESTRQLEQLAERFNLSLVALTRGAKGSVLYSRRLVSDHPGLPVGVVDTVGAGDAFTAAMTLGCLEGYALDEINLLANELAGYVCTQPGATPSIPKRFKGLFSKPTS